MSEDENIVDFFPRVDMIVNIVKELGEIIEEAIMV